MDLASILAIIGYFIPVIFENLVDFIKNYGDGDPDLRGSLEKLKIHMLSARTVIPLIRADTNDGLLELLKELKEAAYEADDLLDQLNYFRLKKQVEEGDNVDNHSSHSKLKKAGEYTTHKVKKIAKSIFSNKKQEGNSEPSSSYLFGDNDKSNTVDMINKIAGKLELITSEVRRNANLLKIDELSQNLMKNSPDDHRVTTSVLQSEQNVLGREKERDEIIELLLNSPAPAAGSSKNIIFVLPIVGIGGVGKTTLAQLVYNNERVKREFDVMMWVHVSQQFNVDRLTREMLEDLGVPKSDLPTSPNRLQVLLKEMLSSKRFLLVLDDVWSSKRSNWEKLYAPLRSGKPGCQILMTTREVTDVSIVDNGIHAMSPIKLKGLPKKEYWSLFEKYAFGGHDISNHPKLEEIGRQIVKKLSGSPLAAKTVGGLLKKKLDVDHWQSILESDIWRLKQNIDDIMPALRLSYQYLPPYLQQCFAYCSVFPKGYIFDVDELVRMWIAQGYVQDKTSGRKKRLMDIGRTYFHELERMYFFEVHNSDEWLVHDLLHDLAEFVSTDECFRVERTKQQELIPRIVRHLFVDLDMIRMDDLKSSCNLRNLRTLIIKGLCKDHIYVILEDLFNKLKRVRVLYLLRSNYGEHDVLPNKMGPMIHLRCILAENVSKLPHFCSQFYQLQFFKYNENFKSCNDFLIGKLTCLQELKKFYVEKEKGHGIGQLKNLRELGGSLDLYNLENIASKTEALEAQLNQKEHLLNLRLFWKKESSPEAAEEVLEGLQPPLNIKGLEIFNYPGVKFPTWVNGLTFLTTLVISYAAVEDRELILILQNLKRLSKLTISGHPKITTLPLVDWLHCPEALTELEITDCPELMSMVGLQALVSLETLTVKRCPKLITTCSGVVVLKEDHTAEEEAASALRVRELTIDDPALLTVLLNTQSLHYLQSLFIYGCELIYLNIEEEEIICSHLTSLKELGIYCCYNLESLPAYLKSLPSLEKLYVIFCDKLQSLPLMPASLKTLSVFNCAKLKSLPLMPASLKNLSITACPSLPKGRYQEAGGEDWHSIAHVNNIIWHSY